MVLVTGTLVKGHPIMSGTLAVCINVDDNKDRITGAPAFLLACSHLSPESSCEG